MRQLHTFLSRICCLTVIALLSACAADAPIVAADAPGAKMLAAEAQAPKIYRFSAGDELSVNAVNRPELTVTVKVDPQGYIAYPYLGQVYVRNLSADEVASRLGQGLKDGEYFNRTALSVSLVGSKEQFVYVLGEVKAPGPVPIVGSVPLLAAIGKAGGQTYNAEMSTVLWIRGSQSPPGVVKVNLESLGDPRATGAQIPNLALIPGDVLYVPDSVIASVERFFNRMTNIIRPFVVLEQGVALYPNVESAFRGQGGNAQQINIVVP